MSKSISDSKKNRLIGFIIVSLTYGFALVSAVITAIYMKNSHPIIIAFTADVVATFVVYIISVFFKNTSLYDPYWSIQPFFILIYFLFNKEIENVNIIRVIVVLILVSIWALRLTLNWASYWTGLKHEDWRYTMYREKNPKLFWFINFTGLQMMPTVLVFLGCLSLYPVLSTGSSHFGIFDMIGIIVTASSILIESIADIQMKKFKSKGENKGKIITIGLWSYSRHPNYLGEVMFWWGLYLFGISADVNFWWTIAGPVLITLLFWFISIPMMEKHNMVKENYEEYINKVPKLIPSFRRKYFKSD